MNVIELVEAQLRAMGADGLYNGNGECACLIGDLSPAGCLCDICEAGWYVPEDEFDKDEFSFMLGPKRAEAVQAEVRG